MEFPKVIEVKLDRASPKSNIFTPKPRGPLIIVFTKHE
jgi:hypothetical protein